jgi:ribosomal protein S18 acetylase RimI-like enzyme
MARICLQVDSKPCVKTPCGLLCFWCVGASVSKDSILKGFAPKPKPPARAWLEHPRRFPRVENFQELWGIGVIFWDMSHPLSPIMEIRLLSEHDVPHYFKLRLEGLEQEPFAFSRSSQEHRVLSLEDVYERVRTTEHKFTLLAFLDGTLAGTVGLVRSTSPKTFHKADVFAMYVAKTARGKGVGRALISELIVRAKLMPGLEWLQLGVSVSQNAARGLYFSLGFVTYGLEPQAIKVGFQAVDLELMALELWA